jgi:hypothetical protein
LVSGIASFAFCLSCSISAHAQLPFANFDTSGNTDGFIEAIAPDFPNTVWLEHNQVDGAGNTSGPGALRVEVSDNNGGGGWAVRLDMASDSNLDAYNAFAQVAQDESKWFLEFDTTILPGEWEDPNLLDPGSIFQLNVGVNSDTGLSDIGGFQQKGDAIGNLNFRSGTVGARIPMTSLPLSTGSTFYQLSIGSTANFLAGEGPPPEGIDLYFDNFRFTQAPPTKAVTLFSWETPDNPATPEIDERYEGWSDRGLNDPGDVGTTVHSIVDNGVAPGAVTDGSFALQIDRVDPADASTFHWGSNFTLSSDDGAGGVNPEIQAQIDDLVSKINSASALAFDLRFDDPDPFSPTFTRFAMYVRDQAGSFFGAEGDAIGAVPIGTTGTYIIPTNVMNDAGTPAVGVLSEAGVMEGTNFLGIGIASNTDGPGLYQIDNLRVIIDLNPADFDMDGDVDGRDYLALLRNFNAENADQSMGDANGDEVVNGQDVAIWESAFGFGIDGSNTISLIGAEATNVPEPSTLLLFGGVLLLMGTRGPGARLPGRP